MGRPVTIVRRTAQTHPAPTPQATPCVLWQGAGHRPFGYGRRKVNGRDTYMHRWVWEQINGPIPDGMCVCHECDNPPCREIDHLFLGTKADNLRDMREKGRDSPPPHRFKLDANALDDIRSSLALGVSRRVLAARYDVHPRTIWRTLAIHNKENSK